jgi:hypothetical protein
MQRFWRREQIEDRALLTLLDFRRQTGLPLEPPIDVDLVGEISCGLYWDWDVLPEPPSTLIWAALYPHERRVVLNEAHVDKFRAKSGLERFTKAHEIGHWILHVDGQSEYSQPLQHSDAVAGNLSQPLQGKTDWIERHADWFAASLLMPATIFVPIAEQHDLSEWRSLYALARTFDVTISALVARLAQLKLSYVDSQGRLHAGDAKPP